MAKKVTKCIGVRLFEINPDEVCDDTLRSAKRWLEIRNLEYRNFCPFILRHRGCDTTCGAFFGWNVKKLNCPRFVMSIEDFSALVEEIYRHGYEQNGPDKQRP